MKLSLLASLVAVASTSKLTVAQATGNLRGGGNERDLSIMDWLAGGGGSGDGTPSLPLDGLEGLDVSDLMTMLGVFMQNEAVADCKDCECNQLWSQLGMGDSGCKSVVMTMGNDENAEPPCLPTEIAEIMTSFGMSRCTK